MSGLNAYRVTGPGGWVGDYAAITPSATYTAPDNCIGLYVKSAGNVTFTTIRSDTAFAFPMHWLICEVCWFVSSGRNQ